MTATLGSKGKGSLTVATLDTSGAAVLVTSRLTPAQAVTTTFSLTTAPQTLAPANPDRLGLSIMCLQGNMTILLGAGAVSTSLYTVRLNSGSRYEVPFGFTGPVTAIFNTDNAAIGAAVTEFLA